MFPSYCFLVVLFFLLLNFVKVESALKNQTAPSVRLGSVPPSPVCLWQGWQRTDCAAISVCAERPALVPLARTLRIQLDFQSARREKHFQLQDERRKNQIY